MGVSRVHGQTASVDRWLTIKTRKLQTCSGTLHKHLATNSLNVFEKLPANSGGSFLGIRKRTLMGCKSAYGGSPFAISMAVIPRLHISACLSLSKYAYSSILFHRGPACLITSGAIQKGVPTKVFLFVI